MDISNHIHQRSSGSQQRRGSVGSIGTVMARRLGESTLPSDRSALGRSTRSDPGCTRSRRLVSFVPDGALCEYLEGSLDEITSEDYENLWYQTDEYQSLREEARDMACGAVQDHKNYYISHSYGYTDEKTQRMLNHWARDVDTLRGLERYSSKDYADMRDQVRKNIRKAVLRTQRQLDKEGVEDFRKRTSVISEVAAILSRESTEFAFMMACADQQAAFEIRMEKSTRIKSSSCSKGSFESVDARRASRRPSSHSIDSIGIGERRGGRKPIRNFQSHVKYPIDDTDASICSNLSGMHFDDPAVMSKHDTPKGPMKIKIRKPWAWSKGDQYCRGKV